MRIRRFSAFRRAFCGFALICAGTALLLSCAQKPQAAMIWTDVPELAVAAQIFNRENDQFAVDLEYKAEAATELKTTTAPPSLIIAKYLLSKPILKRFDSIDELFSKYYLDPNDLYPTLLDAGRQGTSRLLVPVSFDCMLLVEKKHDGTSSGVTTIDAETLGSSSRAFTARIGGKLSALGFSPRWDSSFAEDWILAAGAGFSANSSWKSAATPKPNDPNSWPILWSGAQLSASISALSKLSSGATAEEQNAFSFTYFSKPGYQLLLDNRILYWPMKASDYFKLPYTVKRQLQYRFPVIDQKILLTPDTRYMGIPKGAKNKRAALAFARWLLVPDNQRKIWKEMETQQLLPEYIGPFGGFSSLIQMNNQTFRTYFPEFAQNPLIEGNLPTQSALPDYWDSFSRDFLRHWLDLALSAPAPDSAQSIDENFQTSLERYLGTMPDWLSAVR